MKINININVKFYCLILIFGDDILYNLIDNTLLNLKHDGVSLKN